ASPKQPLAIELSAVEQHLREPQIVLGRRLQSPPSAEICRPIVVLAGPQPRSPWLINRRGTSVSRLVNLVRGVLHAEWCEEALLQEAIEALPRTHFDDSRQRIEANGVAVHPSRARLKLEQRRGERGHVMRERLGPILRNFRLADDPRGMREQIANRDVARRGDKRWKTA